MPAIVEVDGDKGLPRYARRPFKREPDYGVTSVNYDLGELLAKAEKPGQEIDKTGYSPYNIGKENNSLLRGDT